MSTAAKKILSAILYPFLTVGVLLVVWQIAAVSVDNYFLIPSVPDTFRAFGACLASGAFWAGVGGTLLRSLIAFAIALLLAIAAALGAKFSRIFRKILRPVISILRAFPTLAVVLIFAVWVSPQIVPVIVAFLVSFPVLYSGFLGAFDGVDEQLVEMSKLYRVRRRDTVAKLWIPSILPVALPTVGSTLSLTVKLMIAAEIMSSTANSLGALMQGANVFFDMGELFALTIAAVLIAVALEGAVALITKRFTRWRA